MLCLNCKHWNGRKAEMREKIASSDGMAMDREHGWPLGGTCDKFYNWADLEVNGDASVSVQINANFGCVYFKAEEFRAAAEKEGAK